MRTHIALIALCMAGVFAVSGTALADKPSWAGAKHGKNEERTEERREARDASHFNDESRRIINEYYGKQARSGKCPPGLAKKHNGCLPPGQEKKWAKGHALPADLGYQELPRDLVKRLPPPPPQHRYVQVAGDILVIAVGTSIVMDAVEDIFR